MALAFLIIDMQQDMQDRILAGRDHVNTGAAEVISRLAEAARKAGKPVLHVRHHDADESSPMHPSAAGSLPLPCDRELPGEAVFIKSTSSAFASTDLANHLQNEGIDHLMVSGAVSGFCVTSTVRAAADLGYRVSLVEPAVLGFDLPGGAIGARQVHDVTIGLLGADFAEILDESAAMGLLAS